MTTQTETLQYRLCRHIKADGIRCRAAAMTEAAFCFFHDRLHSTPKSTGHVKGTTSLSSGPEIELNGLEDRASIQTALAIVINSLANGYLDLKRARVLLYGIQMATINLKQMNADAAEMDGADDDSYDDLAEITPFHPVEDLYRDRAVDQAITAAFTGANQ